MEIKAKSPFRLNAFRLFRLQINNFKSRTPHTNGYTAYRKCLSENSEETFYNTLYILFNTAYDMYIYSIYTLAPIIRNTTNSEM